MRRRPRARLCSGATLVLCAALWACRDQPLPAPDAVARLDGTEVRYASFESYLERNIRETGSSLPSEVLSQLFDQFLDEVLLLRLADERQLIEADSGARLAVAALLATDGGAAIEPDEAAVERYYRQHLKDFRRPEQVRLSQILVEDRETAEMAAAELAAGRPFHEVARRHSIDAGSASAASQGLLGRADLPTAFADTIFSLTPGTVSRVIEAEYGFHIFLVEERLDAKELPLAEAEPEIRRQLRRDLTEKRLTELVSEARDRYEPEIFVRNLPFNYQGRYADAA